MGHKAVDLLDLELFEKYLWHSRFKVTESYKRTSLKVGEQLWRSAIVYTGDALISQQ